MFGPATDALLARLNPYIELLKAREVRDRICRQFIVKPAALTGRLFNGRPGFARPLAENAQFSLVQALRGRGWQRPEVEAYLGSPISDAVWAEPVAEAA